jgi:Rrf2 family protein
MLSQSSEYALRAVVYLARFPENAFVAKEVAKFTKMPPGYLAKVLQILGKKGILESKKGPNGGFTFSKNPKAITLYDIVNVVDPVRRIECCPINVHHRSDLCALHSFINRTADMIESELQKLTIADLLKEKGTPHHCKFPFGKHQVGPLIGGKRKEC